MYCNVIVSDVRHMRILDVIRKKLSDEHFT